MRCDTVDGVPFLASINDITAPEGCEILFLEMVDSLVDILHEGVEVDAPFSLGGNGCDFVKEVHEMRLARANVSVDE